MTKIIYDESIESLTSEKDEILLMVQDLKGSIITEWIDRNAEKWRNIKLKLMNLNNKVENKIKVTSVHDEQRRDLENLHTELLNINWLLDQYGNYVPAYNVPATRLQPSPSDSQQNDVEVYQVVTPTIQRETDKSQNVLWALWVTAVWIGIGALIYKWIKSLFEEEGAKKENEDGETKENDWEEEENDESKGKDWKENEDDEQKGKDWKENEDDDSKGKNWEENEDKQSREEADNTNWNDKESSGFLKEWEVEHYDESLVRRYKNMVDLLQQKRINYTNHKTMDNYEHITLDSHKWHSWSSIDCYKNKERHYCLHFYEFNYTDKKTISFRAHEFTKSGEMKTGYISNAKLREILDDYDEVIRKYQ